MTEIGTVIDGKYEVLREIGRGGMSVVYLAMDTHLNKQWAVKEIRKKGSGKNDEIVVNSLLAEANMMKRLDHPALPRIVDIIDNGITIYVVMDYIEGESLDKILLEYGAQPEDKVINWAMQIADALSYLHGQKPPIIYRDMKPANVMLKPDGNVTLIDFGTAREFKEKNLADTTCLGTVGYAAPEQFGGMGQTDARTDIYCLGATLYHLVTGMNPCEPPYEIRPIRQINPGLSSGLERIIEKCTQRNPDDRFQSAAELMYALEHYEEIDDTYRKKQKKKLGAFIATLVLSVIFAGVSVWGYMSAEDQKGANYDYQLANASSVQDYYDTILTDPALVDAYIGNADHKTGLVDFLINDGELTAEEASALAKLKGGLEKTDSRGYSSVVKIMDQLRDENPQGYEDVCYEIGEAYLFYYGVGVEKDKYSTAATWFQYAGDRYPVAQMYCDISECLNNITKFSKAEQFAKLNEAYVDLWDQINTLDKKVRDYDDDLKIRVWNEIVDMIRNNASQFCEVAQKQEILDMLSNIRTGSEGITNTFLQDNIAELQKNLEITVSKIESVRTGQAG